MWKENLPRNAPLTSQKKMLITAYNKVCRIICLWIEIFGERDDNQTISYTFKAIFVIKVEA